MNDIYAIIFDLDGVICSTDRYHYLAWKTLADRLQIPFDEQVNRKLRGVSRMESLEIILGERSNTYSDAKKQELAEEKRLVQRNQLELKGSLQDLRDTNKYMQIIEERNRKLAKELAEGPEELPPPAYAAVKPEIRINEDYFREHGLSLDDTEEQPEEKEEKVVAEVSVNLDSEYFKWKAQEESGEGIGTEVADVKRGKKKTIFGKLKGDK